MNRVKFKSTSITKSFLKFKLDRWGLRRHEVNIVTAPSKLRNNQVFKEIEIDEQYPANQDLKNRYKRLKLPLNNIAEIKASSGLHSFVSSCSAKIKRRRDTVEKNLDEMFSSDQENDSDNSNFERKKAKLEDEVIEKHEKSVPSSLIQEPFHGFQEIETKTNALVNDATIQNINEQTASSKTIFSNLWTKLIQVDSNGNTFGMGSVLASPISDFNSDYDDDEFLEPSVLKQLDHNQEDKR